MDLELFKRWITLFDLPSGVVLGIHTMTMIILSVLAFHKNRPLDGSIITVYGVVLGAFAVNKTMTAMNK